MYENGIKKTSGYMRINYATYYQTLLQKYPINSTIPKYPGTRIEYRRHF